MYLLVFMATFDYWRLIFLGKKNNTSSASSGSPLAPESPSWELECEPPPRCQWGSCKPPWRQWDPVGERCVCLDFATTHAEVSVQGRPRYTEGFAHPSGWGEARLSISNIFWVTHIIYIYISLRLRATKNGNVRQDFASNSLASGHDWSNKHQGDPLSQETMGIESEWSIKLRDGSKLKLRAVLIGDNEIGTWKRLEDYEVANNNGDYSFNEANNGNML